jgi:hypothetical protein
MSNPAPLPSPRTRAEGLRDMMLNAINAMSEQELLQVHAHIGPFCLEKLLDITGPQAPTESTPTTHKRLGPAKSKATAQRLRDALGDDWTLQGVTEIVGEQAAPGVLAMKTGYQMYATTAEKIEEFLK